MVERVEGDLITIRAIFDRYDEEFWTMSRDRARELGMTDLDFSERVILKIRIDPPNIEIEGVHEVWTQDEIEQIKKEAEELHRLINWG